MVNERVIGEAVAAAIKMASRLLGKRVCLVMGVIAPPAITWRNCYNRQRWRWVQSAGSLLASSACFSLICAAQPARQTTAASATAFSVFIVVFSGSRFAACILYKSALELSDSVRCNERQSAIMMVRRCMADLKPGVFDAPLGGCGA
jgi:uncharacterized membrane protein YgdD (TMEM256/DUF423 family)